MRFPSCKGFELACGVVITVFFDDLVTLTGTFLGEVHDPRHRRRNLDFHEFILIQLTRPFCKKGAPRIPVGTFVAINVEEIQFITPGVCCHENHDEECHEECHEKKHEECHEKKHEECHEDCHEKKHEKQHEKKGFVTWDDEDHDGKHVLNINCRREDEKQQIININCRSTNDTREADKPTEK